MKKMSVGLLFGLLILFIGLAIIIKVVFNVDIPVVKIAIGIFFIYLGIKIIFGNVGFFSSGDKANVVFGESVIKPDLDKDQTFSTVFGKMTLDLREIVPVNPVTNYEVQTVFGATEILINSDLPIMINGEAVFGNAELSGGNSATFGKATYKSPSYDSSACRINLNAKVVFGEIKVR